MAESINCPRCQAALQLPGVVIGQQVRCTACQTTFTAKLPVPPNALPRGHEKPRDDPHLRTSFVLLAESCPSRARGRMITRKTKITPVQQVVSNCEYPFTRFQETRPR